MGKIPSSVYFLLIGVIGIAFIGILAVSRKDKLDSLEREMSDIAVKLNLDQVQFDKDLVSDEVKKIVEDDKNEASARGVSGTPSIFLGEEQLRYEDVATYKNFKAQVEARLKTAKAEDLPLVFVTYEDYNCHACASFEPIKMQIAKEFLGKIEFDSRHYPFLKDSSYLYARASEAARKQNKFDEFSAELFQINVGQYYTSSKSQVEAEATGN